MARLSVAALLLAALLPLGCGGGGSSDGARAVTEPARVAAGASAAPPLCGRLRVRVTGRVEAEAAVELSGLALSRAQPRVLWAHNDSGDRARVFAVTTGGRLLATFGVSGAESLDWARNHRGLDAQ